jgi:hypothetical protein
VRRGRDLHPVIVSARRVLERGLLSLSLRK